ncbi:MAG: putative ATP-dependent helicase [Glaciihabitans sp.]|nr:putative ATP-dependent helicase [Glaciihabitans sp.]
MAQSPTKQIKDLTAEISSWSNLAEAISNDRNRIAAEADRAEFALRHLTVEVYDDGVQWRILPLREQDSDSLEALERQTALSALSSSDADAFSALATHVAAACRDVKVKFGVRRLFSGKTSRASAEAASTFLADYHAWAVDAQLHERLKSLDHRTRPRVRVDAGSALIDSVGLRVRLLTLGTAKLWPASTLSALPDSVRDIVETLDAEERLRVAAIEAGESVRSAETARLVREMPVERLKEATRDRLRISALLEAGITDVLAVIAKRSALVNLPGVGSTTARSMVGAAYTLWQATYDDMPIRLDLARRTDEASALIRRLSAWEPVRSIVKSTRVIDSVRALAPAADVITPMVTHAIVISTGSSHAELEASILRIHGLADTARRSLDVDPFEPWERFLSRPADYFGMLQELGFNAEDEEKVHGELPEEVVEAIRAFELDTRGLTESLRGYQHFGARFALVQKKVLIGDEMGLGKTFEALAALTHLASKGSRHALVVCPAAVVTNWMREVQSKTNLTPHRLHGVDRANGLRSWVRGGGVAVTTYETLAWLEREQHGIDISCVVFDEAHYIKNPWSQRARRSRALISKIERAILLTGTPLENKVEEFRNLISYLRPDLVVDADELRPRRFKQQVAPAYLRRNQEDVLSELPDLVEVDEWLEMSAADEVAYRDAVWSKNFQEMRQSAMLQGEGSAKIQRLIEIVEEAEDNGRKVLVFSHYRSVLDQVCEILSGTVIGPLTGAVPAAKRQDMVDQFTRSNQGAVLVAQIQAGGVGLNIQAASVVVICEPQLKPTIEWQAIARAHRMGQPQSVQVHRLLTDPGVDLRVTQILARKKELFMEFARASDTAESAPEAFDVSEAELVREVVSAERQRLFPSAAASD